MAQTAERIASGPGWRVSDIHCSDGPQDPRFEEQHGGVCIAVVLDGMFQYRCRQGDALLAPGAVLLGNDGECFECRHDHSQGDHCLSFQYTSEFAEAVLCGVPGVTQRSFRVPCLPPSSQLIALATTSRDPRAQEESAVQLLAYAAAAKPMLGISATAQDERRIADSLHQIENERTSLSSDALSLTTLACHAGMSPYRFLRLFHRVVGMTPHRYILHRRLTRAAERLRKSDDDISAIAFDEGFADLSTFNRRFRTLIGTIPSRYRAKRS